MKDTFDFDRTALRDAYARLRPLLDAYDACQWQGLDRLLDALANVTDEAHAASDLNEHDTNGDA